MSSSQNNRSNRMLVAFSALIGVAVATGAVLFHATGLDLLAHSHLGIPCVVHMLTGIDCPGCGMTRALVLVTQLKWSAALHMNPLVFLLLGFAALHLALEALNRARVMDVGTRFIEPLAGPAVALTLVHWIYRLAA